MRPRWTSRSGSAWNATLCTKASSCSAPTCSSAICRWTSRRAWASVRYGAELSSHSKHTAVTAARQERFATAQHAEQAPLSCPLPPQVVGMNMPLSQQAGYYCDVCDCTLKDSASYLDHINGKWHNRALGMTMRVEKSTVDQVSAGSCLWQHLCSSTSRTAVADAGYAREAR